MLKKSRWEEQELTYGCNKLEMLNFNAKIKIKEGLKGASKGYFPISLEKLKEENKELYDIVRAVKRISENT